MSFDEEVNQVGSHEPLDLSLHVNEVGIGQGLILLVGLVSVYRVKVKVKSRDVTHLHVPNVLHDVLEILVGSQTREFISNHVLLVPGNHLGSVAVIQCRDEGSVILDEVRVVGKVGVRHDDWRYGEKVVSS